jgi:tRNA modification GTPase
MSGMPTDSHTTVTILTPPGRAAVAVVAIDGFSALPLVEQFFQSRRGGNLSDRDVQQIVYGRWGSEPGEDVIACRRGEFRIEVHCHGGAAAVRRIVDDLAAAGAIESSWTNWIASDDNNPIQSAARTALALAPTLRTAAILLDQYHGALQGELESIVGLIDRLKSNLLLSKEVQNRVVARISGLLACASIGLHLTRPWRVVVAGPPNVGKSSLINALLGFQRAIVFDLPGTTRDVVTALTALDGWPVELSDTAGLRASEDPLEAAGVERATAQAAAADCLLLAFDGSQPWTTENQKLLERWPAAIVVHNKSDLGLRGDAAPQGLRASALSGQGIEDVAAAISSRLITKELAPGDAMPFTDEQVAALQSVENTLRNGKLDAARSYLLAMLAG